MVLAVALGACAPSAQYKAAHPSWTAKVNAVCHGFYYGFVISDSSHQDSSPEADAEDLAKGLSGATAAMRELVPSTPRSHLAEFDAALAAQDALAASLRKAANLLRDGDVEAGAHLVLADLNGGSRALDRRFDALGLRQCGSASPLDGQG